MSLIYSGGSEPPQTLHQSLRQTSIKKGPLPVSSRHFKTFTMFVTILILGAFTLFGLSACATHPEQDTESGQQATQQSSMSQNLSQSRSKSEPDFAVVENGIAKSPNDPRSYRSLALENGLEVLLISDPDTDKAAAAMDVHVGSESDPDDRQGLAHFLEHMLFLGTEQYPDADAYQRYINQHGGSHNASTSLDHTNYFFDIDEQFLEPALDRFSQQFVAPLFSPEYVEREKNAVNSEYSAKLKDDGRRFFGVLKQTINQGHPMSRFAVGSLATLADREGSTVRDELLEFYAEHYRAEKMRLVVLGSESLDELETMVKPRFDQIPAQPDLDRLQSEGDPGTLTDRRGKLSPGELHDSRRFLTSAEVPSLVKIQPFKEKRSLTLFFDVASTLPYFHTKPLYYLTYLIGHEGEGSLLSALKKTQLAEALSAGIFINSEDRALLSISVSLTREGVDDYEKVLAGVFDYVELIRNKGIEGWRFEEQSKMMNLSFRFQEKASPIHLVGSLAGRLHDFAPAEVLSAPYSLDEYDPELIRSYADLVRPANMLALLTAPDLKTDQIEPWYDVPYSVQRIDADDIGRLGSTTLDDTGGLHVIKTMLALPERNSFIPDQTDILDGQDDALPVKLIDEPGLETWYDKDTSFGSPRASLYVSLQSPLANDTVRNLVMTELMVRLTEDQLNEYTYEAYVAGLDFKLYKHIRGLTLRIDGYSDKQYVLAEKVLTTLANLKVDPQRFAQIKREILRGLRNAGQSKPFERIATGARRALLQPAWDEEAQIEALESVSAEDMPAFVDAFLSKLHSTILAHGNVSEEQARASTDVVKKVLLRSAEPVSVDKSRVVDINDTVYSSGETTRHPDSAYLYYLQGPTQSYDDRAKFGLLAQMMSTPYYNRVRTQKQMGYVVFATPFTLLEVPGLAFVVQSPGNTPLEIHAETKDFLSDFSKQLEAMSKDDFEQHKSALVTRLLERDKTLEQRSDRYWTEIDTGNDSFDTSNQIATAVQSANRSDILDYYRDNFLNRPGGLLFYAVPEGAPVDSAGQWPPAETVPMPGKIKFVEVNGMFSSKP